MVNKEQQVAMLEVWQQIDNKERFKWLCDIESEIEELKRENEKLIALLGQKMLEQEAIK